MQKHHCITAWLTIVFLAVHLQACTSAQQTPTLTPTLKATFTPTFTLTPSSTPQPTSTATATPDLAATQQYETFFLLVQQYYDAKLIPSTRGTYYRLEDHSDSLAAVNRYRWKTVGMKVRNFILRSHIKMSTANEFSGSTGCGFVFRAFGEYTDAVYVKQGGSVFYLTNNTIWFKQYYKTFSNPAEFDLVLITNETRITAYIDGTRALAYGTFIDTFPGDIGFTVSSGSDKNESQCEFTNNELWVVEK